MKSEIEKIVKIANRLDQMNLHSSADNLTRIAAKIAGRFDDELGKWESSTQRRNEPDDYDDFLIGDYSEMDKLENDPDLQEYKQKAKADSMWYDEDLTDIVENKLKDAIQGTYLDGQIAPGDFYNVIEPWVMDQRKINSFNQDTGPMSLRECFENYEQSVMDDSMFDDDDDGDIPPDFGY